MTNEEFDALFDRVVARCKEIHRTKGVKYANGGDRLGNFKRAAERKGVEPETILAIYMDKHRDSLDWINLQIQKTGMVPPIEQTVDPVIETIVDLVNYSVLNLALIEERAKFEPLSSPQPIDPGIFK